MMRADDLTATRRRWLTVGVAAATLCVALAVTLAVPAGAVEVSDEELRLDAGVQAAEERAEAARDAEQAAEERAEEAAQGLEAAEAALARTTAELDRAVADYEDALAHYERLVAERAAEEAYVEEARGLTEEAREGFGSQIAQRYMQGPVEVSLSDLVLTADTAASALHRAEMLGRASASALERIAEAERGYARSADVARQHEVVTAGLAGAAEDLLAQADDLEEVLAEAVEAHAAAADAHREASEAHAAAADETSEAEAELAEEEDAARERAERAAAFAARHDVDVDVDDARLPDVDGMVCPIGAPHGFSDTWLAPRSGGRQHQGVDMFAVHGMPIYAVDDGTVRLSNNRLGGLSIHLTTDRGDRFYYAHLSGYEVSDGERVEAGQVIGANGNTGNARTTPPHLHWEYRPGGGDTVNPTPLAVELCRP